MATSQQNMFLLDPSLLDLAQNWIDLLWLPVAVLVVHPPQRVKAAAFVVLCAVVMRLQVQIIESTGFDTGFTGWIESSSHMRGLMVYSVFIMLYLILSYFSPETRGAIYLAASLSLFFMAFVASTIVMVI